MAGPAPYDPAYDSTPPAGEKHPINLRELKNILGKIIKHDDQRAAMFADPAKALDAMGYIPNDAAIAFINSLKAADFATAAAAFKPDDPATGMAEM